jgi:WD40 repeat protein
MIQVQKINTLSGHRDCVYTLEKSPNSTQFFSAGGDGVVALWSLENPEIGDLIAKVTNSVYALCTEADENTLLIGQNFEGIHRIDLQNQKELKSVKITDAAIFDIQFYKNEILVACGDGRVLVLDRVLLAVKKYLSASDKSARCIAIAPKLGEFAVGYSDSLIRIFDLESKTLKYTIQAHKNSVFTLSYSLDESFLLSGSRDAHLKVWKTEIPYQLQEDIVAHMFALNHLAFSPDGRYFATASMDKSVKIWDAQSFKLLKIIDKARHAGHGTSVNKVLWTQYQNQLLSASDDRLISVWEIDFGADG